MPSTEHKPSQDIALGVVYDGHQVLVGERTPERHQGGTLEFPGGKLQPNESQQDGLIREMYEETGIKILNMQPLIEFEWDYPQYHLSFSVFKVDAWTPQAPLKDGWQWMPLQEFEAHLFPPANRCIINALRLPDRYLISPSFNDKGHFLKHFSQCFNDGIKLCVFRNYELDDLQYVEILNRLRAHAANSNSEVLIHNRISILDQVQASGIHLSAKQLMGCEQRPVSDDLWFAASCHNEEELDKALSLGVDFVVLGPVHDTASHPGATPLGWEAFSRLVKKIPLPVYAIGGLNTREIGQGCRYGAQGIAALTSLWGAEDLC